MQTQIMTGIIIFYINQKITIQYHLLYIQRCDWYSTSVHVLVTQGFYLAFLEILFSIENWDIGTKMKKFDERYITCYIYKGPLSVLWDEFYVCI